MVLAMRRDEKTAHRPLPTAYTTSPSSYGCTGPS